MQRNLNQMVPPSPPGVPENGLPRFLPYRPASAAAASSVNVPQRVPRLPFNKDPRHTVPTKWSVYRPLLRALKGTSKLRAAVPTAAVALAIAHPSKVRAIETLIRDPTAPVVPGQEAEKASTTKRRPPLPKPSTPDATHAFVLDHVRARWRKGRNLLSVPAAREFILGEQATLAALQDTTKEAEAARTKLEATAGEFAMQVAVHRRAEAEKEAARRRENARRPFLTGGYMRPTVFNVPMPRMKPQPPWISLMIRARTLRRERRMQKDRRADEDIDDMRREIRFWRDLGIDRPHVIGNWASALSEDAGNVGPSSWEDEYTRYKRWVQAQYDLEVRRAQMQFTPEQIEAVTEARRRRHRWRVNRARAARGLGPMWDNNGQRIEGATGTAYGVDRELAPAKEAERVRAKAVRRAEKRAAQRERQRARDTAAMTAGERNNVVPNDSRASERQPTSANDSKRP